MKKYFVSYFFKKDEYVWGVGSAFIETDTPMDETDTIRKVEDKLKNDMNAVGLSLINYKEVTG